MPPLEFVGATGSYRFQAGDRVVLCSLSRADLNGSEGVVMTLESSHRERLPVRLHNGGQLLIKPDNLKLAALSHAVPNGCGLERRGEEQSDSASSDDMPPLDTVGLQAPPQAESAGTDDSLPPLEGPDEGAGFPVKAQLRRPASTEVRGEASVLVDALLEKMRSACAANATLAEVSEALARIEAESHVDWADQRNEKEDLLKKLHTKRNALALSETVCRSAPPPCERNVQELYPEGEGRRHTPLPSGSLPSAGETRPCDGAVVGGAGSGLSVLSRWCQEHQLPMELVQRLQDEEVLDPEELAEIQDDELAQLTVGLKLGPKGRFMRAVQRMRAAARSDKGSTYCPSERC